MFEYFPSNYPWSLAVAASTAMGGELSEIDDACRPIAHLADGTSNKAATEAWYQSWLSVGQRLERLGEEAQERGRELTAGSRYFRASNYFLMAERNMPWADLRRFSTYEKALKLFQKGYALSRHRTERVTVPFEGKELAGYLRMPEGDGPHPAVVFFNGFDSIKEMHYLLYAEDAARRGIAVLFIDQEGTGEAMRLQKICKRVESEIAAGLFVDLLEKTPGIDADKIGVAGISNGGYDAPRAAAFEKRFKCAACLGAFYNADDYMGRFDGGGEAKVTVGLSDLDDHMMTVMGEATPEKAFRAFAKRDLNGVLDKVDVPLLVLHGENDRQVPLWHAERTVAEAVNSPRADLKVFTLSEGGAEHCGIDNAGMQSEYLFDWMAEILKAGAPRA